MNKPVGSELRCPHCNYLIGVGLNWFRTQELECPQCHKVSLIEPSSRDFEEDNQGEDIDL